MSKKILENIEWFHDDEAVARGELGLFHSYMSSLATVINYREGTVDPTALMGASGFAFRIIINETLCPSAFSVFDWENILPEAVKQAGFKCRHISRLWHEADVEEVRRQEAHEAIVKGIGKNTPVIAWDIDSTEWGIIIGFDDDEKLYHCLNFMGQKITLPYDKLGKNGIDILSIIILGNKNNRDPRKICHNAISVAVDHAEQKEWMDRPKYQDGLPAFDLWSSIFEKWALIEKAGKGGNISEDIPFFARLYAGQYYSARCYACDYLKSIANGNSYLLEASAHYKKVSDNLKPLWEHFVRQKPVSAGELKIFAELIKRAKYEEEKSLASLEKYLVCLPG